MITGELEIVFRSILRRILEADGYVVVDELSDRRRPKFGGYEPDLLLERSGEFVVLEAKLYRTSSVQPVIVRNALDALADVFDNEDVDRAVLVVTTTFTEGRFQRLKRDPRLELWDLSKLITLTESSPELAAELADFLRRAGIGAPGIDAPAPSIRVLDEQSEVPRAKEGAILAAALRSCPPSQQGAATFEGIGDRSLRFLFGDQVGKWTPQQRAVDGMFRYDLIARLEPTHSFWLGLARDFRCRYVIFEFKNYSGAIGQDQIYSTEKYLYLSALRSVAVIVSRNGVDEHGTSAMKGALREMGKLILCITADELCLMLQNKDDGSDPTNLLIDKLDEMLTTIGR